MTFFREGTIKIGDRVLAINGINVGGATLQDAHNLMRQCRGTTLFLIEYDVAIVGKIKYHFSSFRYQSIILFRYL